MPSIEPDIVKAAVYEAIAGHGAGVETGKAKSHEGAPA